MQRCPHHLGQGVGIPGTGDHVDGRAQLVKGRVELGRRVVSGEGNGRRAGEHRVEQRLVVAGKTDERVGNSGQRIPAVGRAAAGRGQRVAEFGETLNGDRRDDAFHAGEMLVEHGLAVLDLGGQPAGGDGVPALFFGQLASRGGDEPATSGSFARSAVLDGHADHVSADTKSSGAIDTTSGSRVSVANTYARGVRHGIQLFALIAVLGTAVVYGTDVFCAMVQRPALARVDDRALLAVMGNIHRYGDRRMPVPGVLGMVAAAISAVLAAASGRWTQAGAAGSPSGCSWCGW